MTRQEAREKAAFLVNQMTLEEKCSQMRYDAPAIPRLGIPAYNWWNEGLHGVARAGAATMFPQAIGMAAAFDPQLVEQMADVIAREGRAKYNALSAREDRDIYKGLTFWSPNVNIFRDPRWGRGHETYGEDPCLTSALGVSFVKGLQGDGAVLKAAACAKHFAVHSGPEGIRHGFNAKASAKDMAETYLPAFQALVQQAGVEAVMGAYNAVNGEPSCASPSLQKLLRGDWGFEGHFVSDCWAIRDFHEHHMITATEEESAALAANNGCDLNCGSTYLRIQKAVEDGMVPEDTITESVIRLFTTRYLLGLFDGSEYDAISYYEVEAPGHLALSQKAAEESFVLLKNDGLLPLDRRKIRTLGIIGPNADSRAALTGNYHGTASRYVTIQEGLQDYLGPDVRILTSVGCDLFRDRTEQLAYTLDRLAEAETVARNSDLVILCLGLDETLEGEEGDTGNSYASGDKTDLKLPQVQQRLMERVAQTGTPTVLCLLAGSDIDLSYAADHFGAILDLWYPGSQGGRAAARVLFGEVSPSGKLPVTFYESLDGLGDFEDYSMKGRTYRYMEGQAQYPFGFGLTYGDVYVTQAKIEPLGKKDAGEADPSADARGTHILLPRDTALVRAEVKNDGFVPTQDVVQVYVKPLDPDAPPHPSLAAFCRVQLEAGEKKEVKIPIPAQAFTVVEESGERRDAKIFEIYIACAQPDPRSIQLTGHLPVCLTYRCKKV